MITLKSFAEEVPVTNLQEVHRFLVFENSEGDQLRIPVSEDAVRKVAGFMQKHQPLPVESTKPQEDTSQDEAPESPEVFGGDAGEDSFETQEESPEEIPEPLAKRRRLVQTMTEDDVPSV